MTITAVFRAGAFCLGLLLWFPAFFAYTNNDDVKSRVLGLVLAILSVLCLWAGVSA